jgi:hypothetical protein
MCISSPRHAPRQPSHPVSKANGISSWPSVGQGTTAKSKFLFEGDMKKLNQMTPTTNSAAQIIPADKYRL